MHYFSSCDNFHSEHPVLTHTDRDWHLLLPTDLYRHLLIERFLTVPYSNQVEQNCFDLLTISGPTWNISIPAWQINWRWADFFAGHFSGLLPSNFWGLLFHLMEPSTLATCLLGMLSKAKRTFESLATTFTISEKCSWKKLDFITSDKYSTCPSISKKRSNFMRKTLSYSAPNLNGPYSRFWKYFVKLSTYLVNSQVVKYNVENLKFYVSKNFFVKSTFWYK